MTVLRIDKLSVHAQAAHLVKEASLTLQAGDLVALIGPNGAGKTSLLRAGLGLEASSHGSATLDGENVRALSASARARQVAYLPQLRPLAWPSLVRDVVALGRFAHGAALGRLSDADAAASAKAMEQADITHLANRRADTLSGGELARVHIARAFAAQAPLLVADEPVAALDPRHQLRVLELIKAYVAGGGGALVVLHDIALAASYASRLVWMKEGRILADGPPRETLSPERMAEVFEVDAAIDGKAVHIKAALERP